MPPSSTRPVVRSELNATWPSARASSRRRGVGASVLVCPKSSSSAICSLSRPHTPCAEIQPHTECAVYFASTQQPSLQLLELAEDAHQRDHPVRQKQKH